MSVFSHESPEYRAKYLSMGSGRHNGAYYYSAEIVRGIIPNVITPRPWVTVNVHGCAEDGAIVFIHNNLHPHRYEWLSDYNDLVLVCGIPETIPKVEHLGKAIYLPLSVNVAEVASHRRPKDKRIAYVGRKSKRQGVLFPPGTDMLSGMSRSAFLDEMARYRAVYAVGRCAIEALVLGCEILPYDPRFPDPTRWQIVDTFEAARLLQGMLDEIDGTCHAVE